MNHNLRHHRFWVVTMLLVALILPRCLMAGEMVRMVPVTAPAHQMPCHEMMQGKTGYSSSAKAAATLHCAQQCEHSHTSNLTIKNFSGQVLDHETVFIVAVAAFESLPVVTIPRQGWPPDSDIFIPVSSNLYLDTARLRL